MATRNDSSEGSARGCRRGEPITRPPAKYGFLFSVQAFCAGWKPLRESESRQGPALSIRCEQRRGTRTSFGRTLQRKTGAIGRIASPGAALALACILLGLQPGSAAHGAAAQVRKDGSRWILANASVQRVIETQPFLHTVSVTNLTAGRARRHAIQSRGFVLALDDGKLRLTAVDFQAEAAQSASDADGVRLTVRLRCPKQGMAVTVVYRLGHDAFYLRKHLEIDAAEHLVRWVDVESFRWDIEKLHRFDLDPIPFPMTPWNIPVGRPIFAGSEVFLGVEHPASLNTFDHERWISLRQHPGRKGKLATAAAVIGVCPDRPRERLRDWFEQYIDRNRARPVKRSLQWIAYFDAGMDDEACRRKIAVAESVFRRRGVPLDIVLMDSGWTDPRSIMKINPARPDRIALMSSLVRERLGAKLGLHVITSGVKPMVDKDYLAAQGYDMIYHKNRREGAYCFADPRVLAEFRDNLLRLVRQYGIAAYKFDWGHFECGALGHRGHLPGKEYGFEAGATNFIRAQQAFRQANPEIFLFNTGWFSPWWLRTYDAVFAAGADYNFGLSGPPSFTTASLLCSWRDATIRGNVARWSPFFPINSLMTVDPINYWWHEWEDRAESPLRPFADYFLTACLRGTQMIEVYNNISAWSEAHADAAAAILKWMKAHDDVLLASTRYFGGDPLASEPYGYAHFARNNRGILVIRNPSLQSRTIRIPFDESIGMWPGDNRCVLRIVYPFTFVMPQAVGYGSTHEQKLAGHEVLVFEVWPGDALPEPMPIARRYQVTARQAGKTSFQLQPGPGPIEVFSPVKLAGATLVEARPPRYAVGHVSNVPGTMESCPTSRKARPRIEGNACVVPVRVPEGSRARVAFQFAQPKVEGQVFFDGAPAAADAPHLRLPDAGKRQFGLRAEARDWSLFGLDVGPGEHEVRFQPKSGGMPRRGVLVLLDSSSEVRPTQTIHLEHEPVPRGNEVLLPQNWAWELRYAEQFPLPKADK